MAFFFFFLVLEASFSNLGNNAVVHYIVRLKIASSSGDRNKNVTFSSSKILHESPYLDYVTQHDSADPMILDKLIHAMLGIRVISQERKIEALGDLEQGYSTCRRDLFAFCKTISDLVGTHQIRSDQISRSVVSEFLRPHELQNARSPCPSPNPRVH